MNVQATTEDLWDGIYSNGPAQPGGSLAPRCRSSPNRSTRAARWNSAAREVMMRYGSRAVAGR